MTVTKQNERSLRKDTSFSFFSLTFHRNVLTLMKNYVLYKFLVN